MNTEIARTSAEEQIQRCRRLAMATSDPWLIKALDDYAAELEQSTGICARSGLPADAVPRDTDRPSA